MTNTLEHQAAPGAASPQPFGSQQRADVVRLVATLAGIVALSVATHTIATVAVVVALLVMIMLHELGHFATAKLAGMKVTEFFVGFGPRLWSTRKGETEYGVKAIPAGGYCRIVGMHNLDRVDPADEPRSYRQQPYWRRMSVALAGSAVHFLLAFVLLWVLNGFVGIVNYDKPLLRVADISRLETGQSPAQAAGFRVGDRIVSVDGHPVSRWDDLPAYIQGRPGRPIHFRVVRHGHRLTLTAVPVDLSKVKVANAPPDAPHYSQPHGFVGIGPAYAVRRANPVMAVARAGHDTVTEIATAGKALASFFTPQNLHGYARQLTGQPPTSAASRQGENRFLSPVGFVRVASEAADTGVRPVLLLLVAINVFVGIFNLVPLLPLDGGHVAIATYERIRSRRGRRYHADVAKLLPLTYGVVLVLVTLAVTSLWLDIVRPLANPFQ
jgi:membrane-associated protease RseP (regulator of RpoE activity)